MDGTVVSTLSELVAIDSTSSRSNVPIIDRLEPRLTALGLRVERQSWKDAAGVEKANLVATFGHGLPELGLVGHTDCVPFDAAWSEALTLTERDGKLYGRGACDTKGYLAAALTALERTKGTWKQPLLVVFTADEELGCLGAKRLVEDDLAACRRAIIGEPTKLVPVRANKGYCLAEVEVHGKEGHSAYPDHGASAIFRAARLIGKLEAWSKGSLRAVTNAAFTPPYATVNVGLISGGKAKNIIAGACRFTLEWRPLPGQRIEEVLETVRGFAEALAKEEPGFSATVNPLRLDHGFDTPKSADLLGFLEKETGKKAECVSFGTEGPQLQALGALPVVFGPGDITAAHQTGEFVPKDELFRAVEVLEAAILKFCG
jgi:acetylornithine deacetylase